MLLLVKFPPLPIQTHTSGNLSPRVFLGRLHWNTCFSWIKCNIILFFFFFNIPTQHSETQKYCKSHLTAESQRRAVCSPTPACGGHRWSVTNQRELPIKRELSIKSLLGLPPGESAITCTLHAPPVFSMYLEIWTKGLVLAPLTLVTLRASPCDLPITFYPYSFQEWL